jgi:DNA-binding transcriptional LysR family regulator
MLTDLRGLEALVWISRKGSFTAAAKHLNTTQPAISMRIRELERKLGAPLLDRSRGRPRLTPRGLESVSYADRIVSLTSYLVQSVADLQSMEARIRIGVSESIALSWLSELVTRVTREYKKAVLEMEVDLTTRLWAGLAAGDYDIIMLPEPLTGANVMSESLGTLEFAWMASPQMKLPRGALQPRQLENLPIVTVSRDSNLAAVIDAWFQCGHATPRVVNYCNSLSMVAALTIASVGISILPPAIFGSPLTEGKLVRLSTEPPLQPIGFWAVTPPLAEAHPLARSIARLAQVASTFKR